MKFKILWLADFTVKEVPAGGAEITDSYVIQAGRALGYDITVVRPDVYKREMLEDTELVILSNNFDFSDSMKGPIIMGQKYVAYSHDVGRWGDVLRRHPLLFEKAQANIFLSPGHRDKFLPYLKKANQVICVPPHIPLGFYDKGLNRKHRVMYAGTLYDGKGLGNIIKMAKKNPDLMFDFYYKCSQQHIVSQLKELSNCNLVGFVPKECLSEKYNLYEYFIHLPQMYECFGRAITEAYLCGCKIIVNDNIGAFSYPWSYTEFRKRTLGAHFFFWEELKRLHLV